MLTSGVTPMPAPTSTNGQLVRGVEKKRALRGLDLQPRPGPHLAVEVSAAAPARRAPAVGPLRRRHALDRHAVKILARPLRQRVAANQRPRGVARRQVEREVLPRLESRQRPAVLGHQVERPAVLGLVDDRRHAKRPRAGPRPQRRLAGAGPVNRGLQLVGESGAAPLRFVHLAEGALAQGMQPGHGAQPRRADQRGA